MITTVTQHRKIKLQTFLMFNNKQENSFISFLCACETRLCNFAGGGREEKKGGSSQFFAKRGASTERQAEKDAACERFAGGNEL